MNIWHVVLDRFCLCMLWGWDLRFELCALLCQFPQGVLSIGVLVGVSQLWSTLPIFFSTSSGFCAFCLKILLKLESCLPVMKPLNLFPGKHDVCKSSPSHSSFTRTLRSIMNVVKSSSHSLVIWRMSKWTSLKKQLSRWKTTSMHSSFEDMSFMDGHTSKDQMCICNSQRVLVT